MARWLAFLYGAVHGNMAAANGWMARAERLLEGVEESVEHGRLALDRAPWIDDPGERERCAMAALAIARRFGDRDLEFSALALMGNAYVTAGRVEEGMSLIDEAMAAVSGGEVARIDSIGEIYCRLLGACERATDVRRAEQWMTAARGFVAWGDFVPPTCRLHYGGILIAVGRWEEAEEELLAAARVFEGGLRAMRAAPLMKLAALRVRQGRFEEAERLLEGNESHPRRGRRWPRSRWREAISRWPRTWRGCAWSVRIHPIPPARPCSSCSPTSSWVATTFRPRSMCSSASRRSPPPPATSARPPRAADDGTRTRRRRGRARPCPPSHRPGGLHGASTCRTKPRGRSSSSPGPSQSEAPAGAASEARSALVTFERLGARRDADAAAELLRTVGETGGRAWPKRHGTLTGRETEVLSLLASGCSNAEIAERLYISKRTAEHHVASILSKLELRSRAEAAAYAVRERSETPVAE